MSLDMQDAVQQARKMEMDGIEFYTKAAADAASPMGSRLFGSFAEDERRHLRIIEEIARGLDVDIESMPEPREEIKTVFSNAEVEVGERAVATADEAKAIEIAMGMEQRSYEHYKRCGAQSDNEKEKRLFDRLALEENQHYRMLENTMQYIDDNQEWFLWNEWGLLTGDIMG